VILTPGTELRLPAMDLTPPPTEPGAAPPAPPARVTLRDNERELIRRALAECGGVVGGPNGAAARLGLKRTTLISRMKKLGLAPRDREGVD
jgi:formate hydrogenlyase transcriptional activator